MMKIFFLISILSLYWTNLPAGYQEISDQCDLKILTPSLEGRKTAKIRLENGLEAYFISDPRAPQSAASLSIEVGSWNDPDHYPGMAHFLEHLLFMGSKTYPEENAYEKQVNDNQGIYNAYTASNETVYTFSVNNEAFITTLDIFSHMFSDPLFSSSGVARELHAIDQEFDKNIENEGYRFWMTLKQTGNPNHPNAHFSTGNLQTLQGIPPEEVKKWYATHYSAERAHLVLYSSLSIEELKAQTLRLFSSFPQLKASLPPICKDALFSKSQKGHLIAIEPYKETRTLCLCWELSPDYVQNLSHSAHKLLNHIVQKKHPSSLYAQLKKEGLIENLGCGMDRIGKEAGLFIIAFDLTPDGVKAFQTVIERSFELLHFLETSNIPPYLFDEMQQMAKIDYAFQSRTSPYTFVENSASDLTLEPLETYPLKTVIPTPDSSKEIKRFLKSLTPETCAYVVMAPSALTDLLPDQKERWTGAQYTVREIPKKTLTKWSALPPNPDLSLPEKNPFIPEDLSLLAPCNEEKVPHAPVPVKLCESDRGVLYFWQDTQYQVPEVSWVINLYSPLIGGSPCQKVLSELACLAFDRKLAPIRSFANAASLDLNPCLCSIEPKLTLHLSGYSEKALLLLRQELALLKEPTISTEEFDMCVQEKKTEYANAEKASPLTQALDIQKALLFDVALTGSEKLSALASLTYEDFLFFIGHLFDQFYIEGVLAGNMTEKEAHEVWDTIEETLKGDPYPKKNQPKAKPFSLPASEGPFTICAKTESLGNAACLMIQEGKGSFEKAASHCVLTTVLREDFFDTLRTKQQTGYIVGVKNEFKAALRNETELYHLFYVQSSSHQPEELLARFELFLESYVKDFEKCFPEGRFELIKRSWIEFFETAPRNLQAMTCQLHEMAFDYHGDFALKEKGIAALKKLKYDDIKKDAASFFSRHNVKRVAILVEGKQPEDKCFLYQKVTVQKLKALEKREISNK